MRSETDPVTTEDAYRHLTEGDRVPYLDVPPSFRLDMWQPTLCDVAIPVAHSSLSTRRAAGYRQCRHRRTHGARCWWHRVAP